MSGSSTEQGNGKSRERLAIFGGRSHPAFAEAVCAQLGHPPGRAQLRTFSDGAIEVKLEENVRGRDVFLIQSGQDNPNNHVMELLFLRQGTILNKGAFLTHLYCGREEPEMKTIDVIICRLRKKLAAAGVPTLIDTVWGCGYVLRDPSCTRSMDATP